MMTCLARRGATLLAAGTGQVLRSIQRLEAAAFGPHVGGWRVVAVHRLHVGVTSQGRQQSSSVLQGGRPCGACGRLGNEPAGHFNDVGVFYCASCWGAREVARQHAKSRVQAMGTTAVEDPSAREAAAAFLYAKSELAVRDHDAETVRSCLGVLPELCARRGPGRRTLLHLAASEGLVDSVQAVLETFASTYGKYVELGQAVELFEDAFGITAGEQAFANGHQDIFNILVESACNRPRPSNFSAEHNKAYVKQKLKYDGDVLLDEKGGGVMMGWEEPLMAKHAAAVAPVPGQAVLNVGFGLGLVDNFLQSRLPRTHVIVEAHPDVYAEMCRRGWLARKGVHIVQGRWQDVAEEIIARGPYDGVFFDTYAEMYGDMQGFFALLPRLLCPGGRFSFFNGLSDKNIYAQAISCRVAQMDLATIGLACMYEPVALGEISSDEWCKVVNRYWSLETYYVPLAILLPPNEQGDSLSLPRGNWRASAVQVRDRVGRTLQEKLERARAAAASEGWMS